MLFKTLIYLNIILLWIALFALVTLTGCQTPQIPAHAAEVKHPTLIAYEKQVKTYQVEFVAVRKQICATYKPILDLERIANHSNYIKLLKERDDLIVQAKVKRDNLIRKAWQTMRDKRLNALSVDSQ